MRLLGRRAFRATLGKGLSSLADVLDLARRERDGFVILFIAAFLLFVLPDWINRRTTSKWAPYWGQLPEQTRRWVDSMNREYHMPDTLHPVDPNRATVEDWVRLGLPASLGGRIVRYVEAGGLFREAPDLLRIYGFPEEQFVRVKPWLIFTVDSNRADPVSRPWNTNTIASRNGFPPAKGHQPFTGPKVDIGSAGQAELESLPGIGPVLAARVIRYRDRLGGFHSVDQFAELYGLDSLTWSAVRPWLICQPRISKLRLNSTPEDSLKKHPYIPPWVATQIVNYRNTHKGFDTMEELMALRSVGDSLFRRIEPYLELGVFQPESE